jgi:predicted O-linked N-acetylglucosamine transferase (SPINDLY family)
MALRAAGKLVEACASYERAVALMPRGSASARVRNNIANLLRSMGEYDAAIDSYHEAIAMDAHYEEAYANLSVALFETGRLPEGVAACRSAMDLAKDDATKARMHENILYFLHFSETDPRILLQEHLNWNERWARPIPTSPIVRATPPTDRLKIGYVSPDFREHCQELFLRPLFANHDRSAVEIFCYSGVVHEDATTQWFRGQAHHWREIVGRADAEIIAMIRRDGIDVLVDLTMHLGGGRELMFARRGAPVQAAWLAYPSTTGLTAMDFRLTDSYLDPIVECRDELYSEKSVRLETFWCYDPNIAGIDVSPLPSTKTGFATFGCLNNFAKVTDAMLRLWGEVMRRVPSSRLILMAPKGSRRPEVLAALGVDPERVEFVLPVSRRNYLERYHRIDLCLDTFPCNGHTTSLDALWMGVPVVTLSGETAMSRGGMSVLTNAGLPHFVTQTPEQFVDVATAWAGNTTELSSIRSGLRQRLEQSILMNGKRFAQGMEHAFRNMCAELPEPAGA